MTLVRWFVPGLALLLMAADLPEPAVDFRTYDPAQVKLGQVLFYDRVLSGGRTVSCGTCHNHDNASSNGVALGAPKPKADTMAVTDLAEWEKLNPSPDHAPPLFNLGSREFDTLFSDGRVAVVADGYAVPEGVTLPDGLNDILAVQALFPAITGKELAIDGEASTHTELWDEMAARVRDLEDYAPLFATVGTELADVTVVDIANAIGAFVGTEWRADGAPFDRFLRGDNAALTAEQKRGADLFYGKAGCAACHAGPFQTDHEFHVVATPPRRFDADFTTGLGKVKLGRFDVTGEDADRYAYRTPSLRNVTATAPYGHAGSHPTLEGYLRHHLDPLPTVRAWIRDRIATRLPDDVAELMFQLSERNTLDPVALAENEVADLLSFLDALTDPASLKGRLGKPENVPSNLEMD